MDAAWAGLIGAGVGAAATFAGGWFSQRRADRREDMRWQRERERESDVRSHEDANRSYEERRRSYMEFMKDWNERSDTSFLGRLEDSASEPPEDYLGPLYYHLEQVRTFGSRRAGELASQAFDALRDYAYRDGKLPQDGSLDALREQIRRDLGVPDDPRAPDGPAPKLKDAGPSEID